MATDPSLPSFTVYVDLDTMTYSFVCDGIPLEVLNGILIDLAEKSNNKELPGLNDS